MGGKRFLFILGRPPDCGGAGRETLDQAMTAAAFDQPVTVLVLDDGVYQMLRAPRPEAAGAMVTSPLFEALRLYDVEAVYVERESLAERGLQAGDLVIPVALVGRAEVAGLLEVADVAVGG
jgi:tRNA 2-thiouridine synthesizing protein C